MIYTYRYQHNMSYYLHGVTCFLLRKILIYQHQKHTRSNHDHARCCTQKFISRSSQWKFIRFLYRLFSSITEEKSIVPAFLAKLKRNVSYRSSLYIVNRLNMIIEEVMGKMSWIIHMSLYRWRFWIFLFFSLSSIEYFLNIMMHSFIQELLT